MAEGEYGREFWEAAWRRVLRERPEVVATRPPTAHLVSELEGLPPGRALDAGCGHGTDALWLAARGWEVRALDFSPVALAHARSVAETMGPEIAERVAWAETDLRAWAPAPATFDLVTCVHVHVAGIVRDFVLRLGAGVRAGGTLLLVGHPPRDPRTGEPTAAAGQNQVTVEAAVEALATGWRLEVAEYRPRPSGSGMDAVVRARRDG